MEVTGLFSLYQAQSACLAIVLSISEDAEGQNATQERILGYLHQFIATMDSDKVRTFSRYEWSSTYCLGHFIVLLPIHAPNHLSCHLPTYATYICTQKLFWSFANAWPASICIISEPVD